MSTLKFHAVNLLKWSAVSSGFAVFLMLVLLLSGWIYIQLLAFILTL